MTDLLIGIVMIDQSTHEEEITRIEKGETHVLSTH